MKLLSFVVAVWSFATIAVAELPPVAVPGEGALVSSEFIYQLEGRLWWRGGHLPSGQPLSAFEIIILGSRCGSSG